MINYKTVGNEPNVTGDENWGIAVVGDNLTVGKNATITANKMITENVKEGDKI